MKVEDSTQRSQPAGRINQDIAMLNTNTIQTAGGRKRQTESALEPAEAGEDAISENLGHGKK